METPTTLQNHQIPGFVRDIDHPWIKENMTTLESLDTNDVLCNPGSPLRSQLPAVPDDLFKHLAVLDGNSAVQSQDAWSGTRDRLHEIRRCEEALRTCETLRVDISDSREPPEDVPYLFVDVLSQMISLRELEWIRSPKDTASIAVFASAFHEHQLCLPTVKEMHLESNMHCLVQLAPELTSLTTRDSPHDPLEIISAGRSASKLTNFTMSTAWTSNLVENVLEAMPFLQSLGLHGSIAPKYTVREGQELKDILEVLKKFKHLSQLRLPNVQRLVLYEVLGDDNNMCGNVYFGSKGRKFGRREGRWTISDVERVGRLVDEYLPHLKSLSILDLRTDLKTRKETGALVWPWTGRLREHLLETWPRYQQHMLSSGTDDGDDPPDGPVFDTWEEDEIMLNEDWEGVHISHEAVQQIKAEFRRRMRPRNKWFWWR